jgi:hypothetical protein
MRRVLGAAVAAVALAAGLLGPASANVVGHEGCTPGYWKNHTDNWEEASPNQLVITIYDVSPALLLVTLEQALSLQGGPGVEGAERNLVRAATAAWLNAAHDGLGYPWRRNAPGLDGRPPLQAYVNEALASGDRETMLAAAERLDADNNLGCPL